MASANGHGNGHPHGPLDGNGYAPENRIEGFLADRLPPQNLEAEQGVIGSVLLDNEVLTDVRGIVTAADFYRDTHQVLFEVICSLADRGKPVDCVTLADELTRLGRFEAIGGDDTLEAIIGVVPHAANARHYADIVRQKAQYRAVIALLEETQRDAYSQAHPAAELLARAGDRLSRVEQEREEEPEFTGLRPWPDPPDPAISHGLAGEIIALLAPHTESDPMAILGQFLVCFGNVIGRRAHWRVEATPHYTKLFLCVVGNSSKARKGTSWDHVRWLMARCDEVWVRDRILSGLSTGEGLINQVRDPIYRREKVHGHKAIVGEGYQEVLVDPGVEDKRALFVESEFGSTLAAMSRDGNTLSAKLREAWDRDYISSSPKNNAVRSTGAHVSMIGHITAEELHSLLTRTDASNGFANRFLWLCARRSQYLPHGGRLFDENFTDVTNRLREAITFGRMEFVKDIAPMVRDRDANALWEAVYPSLTEPKPGLLGAVTSRAEAQAMRLACIYALLDCSKYIRRHHLEAGLAFWRYCEQSAAYIFGDALGDPDAEKLLGALRAAPEAGLSLYQIRRQVFHGHKSKEQIAAILAVLARSGLAVMRTDTSTKKPTTYWTTIQQEGGTSEV
jgi:hypothetical protein